MFSLFESIQRLNSGIFITKLEKPINQKSRSQRQKENRKNRTDEFIKSVDAIRCPFALTRLYKKWGWW